MAAIAAQEFAPIRRPAGLPAAHVGKGDASGEIGAVGIAREQGAGRLIQLGDDVRRGRGARLAKRPFHKADNRDAPRPAGHVRDLDPRDLQGIVKGTNWVSSAASSRPAYSNLEYPWPCRTV